MKKLFVSSIIAITATVAVANSQINIKKVNKIIAKVIRAETTPLINTIDFKFDEKSNLESVKTLNTRATLSATATHSKWSKSKTSLDANATVKTLESTEENSKVEIGTSLGSKTDAVAFYSYLTGVIAKDMTDDPELKDIEKEFLALFTVASGTKKLDEIPAQLEQFVVLLKKLVAIETPENPDADWTTYAELVNSLTVDTRINNYKTIEVVLKTSKAVAVDNDVINSLYIRITEKGIRVGGVLTLNTLTADAASLLETVRNFLTSIETADKDTIDELRSMARSYIEMASNFVNGDQN